MWSNRHPSCILPIGVIQVGMAFSGQSANLFPVSDKFIFLQMDLRGILGMGLLQTLCITSQCVNLIEREENIYLDHKLFNLINIFLFYRASPYLIFQGSQISL